MHGGTLMFRTSILIGYWKQVELQPSTLTCPAQRRPIGTCPISERTPTRPEWHRGKRPNSSNSSGVNRRRNKGRWVLFYDMICLPYIYFYLHFIHRHYWGFTLYWSHSLLFIWSFYFAILFLIHILYLVTSVCMFACISSWISWKLLWYKQLYQWVNVRLSPRTRY